MTPLKNPNVHLKDERWSENYPKTLPEDHGPILWMKNHTKFPNKMVAIQSHSTFKGSYSTTKWDLIMDWGQFNLSKSKPK